MKKYPYIPSLRPLKKFLESIQTMGIPSKITQKSLPQIGFKSSNARYIPGILRFIGFTDSSSVPTEEYKNFRKRGMSKSVMAKALRKAYADLFKLYPDAHKRDSQTLRDFFSGTTKAGERVLEMTVGTFKTLCSFADLEAPAIAPTPTPTPPTAAPTPTPAPAVQLPVTKEGGVNLNVNIRLELPATQDAEIYDKIFKSLKKHLLTPSSKED